MNASPFSVSESTPNSSVFLLQEAPERDLPDDARPIVRLPPVAFRTP